MEIELEVAEIQSFDDTKFVDDFSREIYEQTYLYGNDGDVNGTHYRVARDIASVEEDKDYWTQKFLWVLKDFKFVPGGRIISNAGTGLKGTTYINCFVDGFIGKNQDSMEGIFDALRRQGLILKSEGGYGFCSDVMRPRGAFVHGIGNGSPGAIKMLEMWDKQSEVITEGSGKKNANGKGKVKIRKGAQMVTMSCWHPDFPEFLVIKQTPGKLTKFNMSILVTDDFMDAVKNNDPWNLEFPTIDTDEEVAFYNEEWNGNLKRWKEKGYPTTVYKTYENANELWDVIMESTYSRNEPGILFVDTINRMNNLWYCEHISATNPCGEQMLPIGGVCLLGSLNLTQFIDFDKQDWDYDKLREVIPIAVRFMDNVNDKTRVPLKIQREDLVNKRRIGLGIMGYGSALMMMKIRYGSDVALGLTEKLMKFISNTAYQSSALIAEEKEPFKLFDKEKYLKGNYVKKLNKKTKEMIEKYGIRNSHLLSIQPTGNTAIFANNVSGGLEPIFMLEYVRTTTMPYPPEGLGMPRNIDWENQKFDFDANGIEWKWEKEGDENILKIEFDGTVWKIDQARGLLKETVVKDYAVRYFEERGKFTPKRRWTATTTELSIDAHINTMGIIANYIDSAMSKTVNIPNDYFFEDFKKIYIDTYSTGTIKGCTTYRAGTMTSVLAKVKDENQNGIFKIEKTSAPKRPKELNCDVHHITAMGKKWIVLIGLFGEDPYEVFAFKNKKIHLNPKWKTGKLVKSKRGVYDLEIDEGIIIENVKEHFETDEQEALTRMISTCLRHGADIHFVYEQLQKSEGAIVSFSKAIGRTLKKYIKNNTLASESLCPECDDISGLTYQENCMKCKNCGYSYC